MIRVKAVGRPELEPYSMPDRFKLEVVYFMTPGDMAGSPSLLSGEYWVRQQDIKTWLDDGVFRIISPLDAQSQAEIELSEAQEGWLEWMASNQIEHVRIEAK